MVPRGGRASRLDASRYRAGEPPNGGKRFRAYHVLHDHLGGEVFLDGGGRHWRDKGAAFENPRERGVHEKSGQRVIRDSTPVSDVSERARETREKTGSRARSDNSEAYLARERSSVWRVVRPGAQRPREKRRSGFARKKRLANSRRVGATESVSVTRSVLNFFAGLFRARG